ncbi:MAG: 2-oxoacid:acceptor oxidoreductase family protein [Syntrophaceae bacterium]|nr:2-oxoacid:acceptor oxidoreductase family protein [Syntrophaceae bacterium]
MSEMRQVRLSGFGGQGIVLAGLLLGQAGVMEGKYVTGSNSYGAQARGSGCKSEIVFSDHPIHYPHLIIADILVAMSQGAYQTYDEEVKESGIILYDRGRVVPNMELNVKQLGVSATEISLKKLKNKQVANIVMLGALVETTGIVSPRAIRKAIALHIPKRFQALNLKAFHKGMELGKQINA